MENTVRLRAAHPIAMDMDNVKQTMQWNGSAGVVLGGMEQAAIYIWNRIAQIEKTTMVVSKLVVWQLILLLKTISPAVT